MRRTHQRNGAFTRIELLVIALILVILVGVLLPQMAQKKRYARRVACVGCLKHIILSELVWMNDNAKDRLSWQIPTNQRGSLEYLNGGKLFPHFKALSNELTTPKILVCPADNRKSAADFGTLGDSNLSYFMNMDASIGRRTVSPPDNPIETTVFGDRNMTNNTGPRGGIVSVNPANYRSLGWSSRMHNNRWTRYETSIGNVATSDGSVQKMTPTNLQSTFKHDISAGSSNRLAVP